MIRNYDGCIMGVFLGVMQLNNYHIFENLKMNGL